MKMKWNRVLMVTVCAVAAALLLESPVQAQRGGRGRRGFGFREQTLSVVRVAANPAVQKDLGLDAEHGKKVNGITQAYQEELRTAMADLGFSREAFEGLSGEERRQKFQELTEKREEATRKLDEKYSGKLAEALQAEQMRRLQQIAWQAAGAQALEDPMLIATLDLSQEQQGQLAAIRRDYDQKTRELFRRGDSSSREERFEQIRDLQAEREGKLMAVLSTEQQDKLKELKGEPFDVSQLRGRPRRDGQRPPGNRT